MSSTEPQPFQLGITMAGAISAGAYSGGVFDMIFEVLDAWEAAKAANAPGVPRHRVVVPVLSGASAGSITGAMGLVALADPASGTPEVHPYGSLGTVTTRLPRLYAAWVTGPQFVGTGDARALLGLADLKASIRSALDTTILDGIAQSALAGLAGTRRRDSLSTGVHLFLTATNLQGTPYQITFNAAGQSEAHIMTCHADRVHFVLQGLGTTPVESRWADPDPAIPLDVATLVNKREPHTSPEWSGFLEATLASSAFPVGLRARALPAQSFDQLARRQWPIDSSRTGPDRFTLPPAWSATIGDINRLAVDGGVIDNEPFELARWALMDAPPTRNPRAPKAADRAVLMIDPFPSEQVQPPALPDDALFSVVRMFVPMLINQARFKLDAVVAAMDPEVSSRFLISPRRYLQTPQGWNKDAEENGIACGLMGGFGGFLSEAMRAHDYQLGRLNAYRFLKVHFCFPRENKVIGPGYAGLDDAQAQVFEENKGPEPLFQMIPVMPGVKEPVALQWPRATQAEVDRFVAAAGVRAKALAVQAAGSALGGMVALLFRMGLRDAVEDFVRWTLMAELYRRDQFAALPPAIDTALDPIGRRVLAALAEPRFAARTAEGIKTQLHVDRAEVDRRISVLAPLLEQGPRFETWRLAARRPPGWLARQVMGEGKVG